MPWTAKDKDPITPQQQEAYDQLCEALKPPARINKPRKVKPGATRHDYKQRYEQARQLMFAREYPAAWAVGGYYGKAIAIDTTNGFQKYIQDVLNNLGHQCERVNVMGIQVKGEYRPTGSTKGSSDLHAVLIGGRAWKIEIKKGADTLSGSQERYQAKMISVGALHSVIYVGDTDKFWDEFDLYIKM